MRMATKKSTKKTVSFNKFFPDMDSYVTLKGSYDPDSVLNNVFFDDFDLDLTIQNGVGRYVNLYTWFDDKDTSLTQLKAIHEATGKAIEFIEQVKAYQKEAKKKEPIKVEPRVTKQRK